MNNRLVKAGRFAVAIIALCLAAAPAMAQGGLEGKAAPAFTATSLDGKTVSLSSLKGNVVIINFWATWCPPCRAEIPEFVQFYRDYEKKGVRIIGVGVGDKEDALRKFGAVNRITYYIVNDSKGRLASLYGGIRAIPTTVVIDRNGIVRNVAIGGVDRGELIKMVEPFLVNAP